jgi:cytoskeletal protein CcmA (bactofilin family)
MFGRGKKDEQMESKKETTPGTAFLGSGHVVKGEVGGQEDLIIKGFVKGKVDLKNHSLIIEKGGRVDGDIIVNELTLRGSVNGNVYATGKVFVATEALMRGDITAARISISDGAVFKGSIKMEDSVEKVFPAKEKTDLKPSKDKPKKKEEEDLLTG